MVVLMNMGVAEIMGVIMPVMMDMTDVVFLEEPDAVCEHEGPKNEYDQA